MRLRIRCRCITYAVIFSQIILLIWFFSQPLDPPKDFLKRLLKSGGQGILHLEDQPSSHYFVTHGKDVCVKEGTIVSKSNTSHCACKQGWMGRRCGVPEVLQQTEWMQHSEHTKLLQLRKRVKRVIMIAPVSYDFDVLKINVNELNNLVDIFVVGERNNSVGNTTSLPLLEKFKKGWLKAFQEKIVYVPISNKDTANTSLSDAVIRFGLRLISDVRPDDLLIFTSGEEILNRDLITFLKVFHGYPMPIRCNFKHYLHGFYRQVPDGPANVTSPPVCIVSLWFFFNAYEYQVSNLQKGQVLPESVKFLKASDQPVMDWTVADAGWKCHLCMTVQNMFRRFSDSPENLQPDWFMNSTSSIFFLQRLVKFGQDENLNRVGKDVDPTQENVPQHVWKYQEKFAYLMENPYENVSIHSII